MSVNNVLVLLPLSPAQRARLEAGAPDARFVYAADGAGGSGLSIDPSIVTSEQLAEADVIVGNFPPARLAEAANLRLLQLNSAGYDNYSAVTLPAGLAVANAGGAYGQAVSEHMLAMVLALMKRLPGYCDNQRECAWRDLGPVTSFKGANVVVLGAGDIGSRFAQLASGLGARAVGLRRHADGPVPAGFAEIRPMDDLYRSLGEADVIASFLPSAPSTRGLANAEFFDACKPGAYFANGGRGDLVVADDLIAALSSDQLAGAALDVTSPEPLPFDHPLWDAPNVFITPHISGGFHLPEVLDNIVDIAASNLRCLEADEPMRNIVLTGSGC